MTVDQTRANLIICCASERSLHQVWLDGDPQRNWDLCVIPFRPLAPRQSTGIMITPITNELKFAAFHTLLTKNNWWRAYKRIALADEDIFAMPKTWSLFFDFVEQLDAGLSAPALTPNSLFSHPVTVRQRGCLAHRTNFVEGMMPCFRVDVLDKLLYTFTADPSGAGWGLEYAWSKVLDNKGIYIVDATPVTHWRPGAYTRSYMPEVNAVIAKFGASPVETIYEFIRFDPVGATGQTGATGAPIPSGWSPDA